MKRFAIRLAAILTYLFRPLKAVGRENLPKGENFVLAANHTELFDPLSILFTYPSSLSIMAKKELFSFKPFAAILRFGGAFPVDRSKNDVSAMKYAIKTLKQGESLLLFPEGTRVKEGDAVAAKNGAVAFAKMTKTRIIPVAICGKHRIFSVTKVVYGEPISLEEYYNEKLDGEKISDISENILKKIKKMVEEQKKNSCNS